MADEKEVSFVAKVGVQNSSAMVYIPKGSVRLGNIKTGDWVEVTLKKRKKG